MTTTTIPALSIQNVGRRFGHVQANKNVSIDLYSNRIHALIGENGAGKSTLVSILYGLHQADEGEMKLYGSSYQPRSPADSLSNKIGIVQQHFSLIPAFTVLENLLLGQEFCSTVGLNKKLAEQHIKQKLKPYGIELPLHESVKFLPVGIQQRVEIAKVLLRDVSIVLFDEPTAALVPSEIDEFLKTLRTLRDRGLAVVFITHHLPEVLQVADEVTVLRQGRVVLQGNINQFSEEELATAIVGEKLPEETFPELSIGSPLMAFHNINVFKTKSADVELQDLNVEIHEGEIFGVAGVSGNGQNEWIETLLGLRNIQNGTLHWENENISGYTPIERRQLGIAYIPEDRWKDGILPEFSLYENFMLNRYGLQASNHFWVRSKSIFDRVTSCIDEYKIQTPSADESISSLSGGHQQRAIIARELLQSPRLIVAHNPSRGLDIRAAGFVHDILHRSAANGAALLLFSSDLHELFLLSHRIAVIYKGRVVEIRQSKEWTGYELGRAMVGGDS